MSSFRLAAQHVEQPRRRGFLSAQNGRTKQIMRISDAAGLIQTDKIAGRQAQTWGDLGSGTGTFTVALATLLTPGSIIHAFDRDAGSLAKIPASYQQVEIHKHLADLRSKDLPLPALDGVLMANFLHFIEDQESFLQRLRTLCSRLLIVEYENRSPSRWVPYPLSFSVLQKLLREQGFPAVTQLRTRRSRFGGELYSAFAE
jgi:SAM-dependent methyltransferase